MVGRLLEERVERLGVARGGRLLPLRLQRPLGMAHDDDAPRRHHREGARGVEHGAQRGLPAVEAVDVEGAQPFVHGLLERVRDVALLLLVVTEHEIEGIELPGRDPAAHRVRRGGAHRPDS